jgi:hypothetical protein
MLVMRQFTRVSSRSSFVLSSMSEIVARLLGGFVKDRAALMSQMCHKRRLRSHGIDVLIEEHDERRGVLAAPPEAS